jgi:hypothetical protein
MGGGFSRNRVQFHCDLIVSKNDHEAVYSGFTDDKKSPTDCGHLVYENPRVQSEYTGTFRNNSGLWCQDGVGCGKFTDGRIIFGSWNQDQLTVGLEILRADSPVMYLGHFKDMHRDGVGLEINLESNETYECMWCKGNRFGEGILGKLTVDSPDPAALILDELPITRLTFFPSITDNESPRNHPPPAIFRDDVPAHQRLLAQAFDAVRTARASARGALRARAAAQALCSEHREALARVGAGGSKKLWASLYARWQRTLQPSLKISPDTPADPTDAALAAQDLPSAVSWTKQDADGQGGRLAPRTAAEAEAEEAELDYQRELAEAQEAEERAALEKQIGLQLQVGRRMCS